MGCGYFGGETCIVGKRCLRKNSEPAGYIAKAKMSPALSQRIAITMYAVPEFWVPVLLTFVHSVGLMSVIVRFRTQKRHREANKTVTNHCWLKNKLSVVYFPNSKQTRKYKDHAHGLLPKTAKKSTYSPLRNFRHKYLKETHNRRQSWSYTFDWHLVRFLSAVLILGSPSGAASPESPYL